MYSDRCADGLADTRTKQEGHVGAGQQQYKERVMLQNQTLLTCHYLPSLA
jgi:hypothetical protein